MNSSSNVSTHSFISNVKDKSTSNKVELIIDALEDVISTFKTQGTPEGKELLREILLRNHLLSGSPVLKSSVNVDATKNKVGISK